MPSWLPMLAVAAFFLLAIGLRSVLQKARHGTYGIVLFAGGRQQNWRDAAVVVLFASLPVQAWVVWQRGMDPADLDASLPGAECWPWTGSVLAFGGLLLLLVAQLQLGASWRIGVDARRPAALVERGLYRYSRNPIYVAIGLFLLGHLLLVPTWVSLVQWLGATIGFHTQVRTEEDWLLRTHGDAYRAYAARVARYLPRLGRRR